MLARGLSVSVKVANDPVGLTARISVVVRWPEPITWSGFAEDLASAAHGPAGAAGLRAPLRERERDALHGHRRHPLRRLLRVSAESGASRLLHLGRGRARRGCADRATAVRGSAGGGPPLRRSLGAPLGPGR